MRNNSFCYNLNTPRLSVRRCPSALLEQLGAVVYRGKAGQKFVFQMNEAEKAATRDLQNKNLAAALAQPCDMLVLDEAGSAWELDMVDKAMAAVVLPLPSP